METKPDFHPLAFSPVVGAENARHVCLQYSVGSTPDDPSYDFERDYLSISGYVPLKYQPIIAAAPELLEALKFCKDQLETVKDGSVGGIPTSLVALIPEAIEAADAAIARATGASS